MHNNYFVLKQLSFKLNQLLVGLPLYSCYTQNKNELIFHFKNSTREYFVEVIMRSDFCMIRVPDNLTRARKNSTSLFQEILHTEVLAVKCFENERCLSIELSSNWNLLIKMFGNRSNVILCVDGTAHSVFKKRLKEDLTIDVGNMDRRFEVTRALFDQLEGDFQKVLPTMGGEIKKHLVKLDYSSLDMDQKWALFANTLESLNEPEYFIYQSGPLPQFTLFQPQNYLFRTSDVLQALEYFFTRYTRDQQLSSTRKVLLRNLERNKKRAMASITKSNKRIQGLDKGVSYQDIADLIMANMHQIPNGVELIELPDFETGSAISIKLKPTLNAQQNAERYYRKSKNQQQELKILLKNLARSRRELSTAEKHIQQIESCHDLKQLKAYAKSLSLSASSENKPTISRFKEFKVQGFHIMVGKNASNNDLLTQKFTHKEDLWLHAKDVKGSHVVLKHIPGKPFPSQVVETAASLAAYYSKRKNDTLCPVIYTQKKYVRKPKGAAPGQVIVEKEKVLLVPPKPLTRR